MAPVLTALYELTTHHRTVCFRSSSQHVPAILLWMTFPRSLTTTPFERSSTGRFEACSCKPASGGLLPSSVQHHKLSLVFVTHSRPCATTIRQAACARERRPPTPAVSSAPSDGPWRDRQRHRARPSS